MKIRLCKYEQDFMAQCKKLRLNVVKDTDFCPIVQAKGKRLRKILIMCPWKKTHFAIVILGNTCKQKNKFIRRVQDTGANNKVLLDGDTEAVVLVVNEDMAKIVRPLKFIRNKNLTDEQRKAIGERLAKAREAKNDTL